MATTQEFYIREASENEARGPFNMEQLVSLAETGQVFLLDIMAKANDHARIVR